MLKALVRYDPCITSRVYSFPNGMAVEESLKRNVLDLKRIGKLGILLARSVCAACMPRFLRLPIQEMTDFVIN